jgi:predicted Zn-dependent protease
MALLDGNPLAAETQAREILRILPDDARALFILGAARRRQGDLQGARSHLCRVMQAYPGSAYVHQEFGLVLAGLGESAESVRVLQKAHDLRRETPDAWRRLGEQLALSGAVDHAALADAEQSLGATIAHSATLAAALKALREERLPESVRLLQQHLIAAPNDLAARIVLAQTAARLGHLEDAGDILANCVGRDPESADARFVYAQVLHAQHRPHEALAQLRALPAGAAATLRARYLRLACLILTGEYQDAIDAAAWLLEAQPNEPAFHISHGQTLRIAGDAAAAEAAFRRALVLRPNAGEAWWCLADLKTTSFTDADIALMREAAETAALTETDRVQAGYALGKALEDRGAWGASFAAYAQAAKLWRSRLRYDADHTTATVGMTCALCTPGFFQSRPRGSTDEAPIFIVGMPRAGSTLVEQILVSHPDVEPTMELPYMAQIAIGLSRQGRQGTGPDYYETVAALDQPAMARLAEQYLSDAARHRRRGAPRFIDKLPGNFMHVGLIELLLPHARIIDVRREPMAACFSMFKQLFSGGQEFTYDFTELGRYWRDYVAIMAHFDTILPGRIYRVSYERLVENTEHVIRGLLEHCGLAFDDACLRFWETQRPIATHSSEQVRKPINRAAANQWRTYETFLVELSAALGKI